MKILSLCGSMRGASSNGFILNKVKSLYSKHEWINFELKQLPYFDPDLQYSTNLPPSVSQLRLLASECSLIFISTPEYAHGMPGILKNALEWLFYEGTQKKPAAFVVASAQGEFAKDQLLEVLKTMDFSISNERTYLMKSPRSKFSKNGEWADLDEEKTFNNFCSNVFKDLSSLNN